MTEKYLSDEIGSLEDSVKLQLGDDEIRIAESWDIAEGVLRRFGFRRARTHDDRCANSWIGQFGAAH